MVLYKSERIASVEATLVVAGAADDFELFALAAGIAFPGSAINRSDDCATAVSTQMATIANASASPRK
jgi:hypothetical protein